MAETESAFRDMLGGFHGGFAAKLAEAWFAADSSNRARIETAFETLIQRVVNSLQRKSNAP